MTGADRALARARAGDEDAFGELVQPYRRELQVHCYRLLGSTQDAEDLVQETMLLAWRGLGRFEGRSSLRAWLYRIATNACIGALRRRGRRLPEVAPPPEPPGEPPQPTRLEEPVWLEPYPDSLLDGVPDRAPGPEARFDVRESVELAFVTALQRLPVRQRAVLVMRDVLGFRASEVAEALELSEAAVNSALQRARAAAEEGWVARDRERAPLPRSARERELVGEFADAFQNGDVDAVVALLTSDVRLTMPPEPVEYQGRAAIGEFFSTVPAGGDLTRLRLVPTRANGAPALAVYLRDAHTPRLHAYGIMVLTLSDDGISAITGFPDTSVFPCFGLPRTLRD